MKVCGSDGKIMLLLVCAFILTNKAVLALFCLQVATFR
jgi:hypothetical protein